MKRDTKYKIRERPQTPRDSFVSPETQCEPRTVYRSDSRWDPECNDGRFGRLPFCEKWQNETRTLFIAGAIAVIAGFLFPLSAHIFDVLLIFSICLTASVLIITFSAHRALEVSGFPLLIVLATVLRMTLSVACAKLIFLQGDAGTITNVLGRLVVSGNLSFTILVFGLPAMIILWIVCRAVNGIMRSGIEFTSDIVPVRQLNINNDLKAGVINEAQAVSLRAKIAREAGFFAAMGSAAKFIRCDAVIELAIITVNIVFSTAMVAAMSTSAEISAKMHQTLAVGAGTVAQLSVLITAFAAEYLVRKSATRAASDVELWESRQVDTERIKVTAKEVVSPPATEQQDGKTVIPIKNAAMIESRFIESESVKINYPALTSNIDADEKMITEELEWSDESQNADSDNKDDLSLWTFREIKDSSCYEPIAELIETKSTDHAKTILMAAESIEELPVTVPVNVAMRLAQKNKKCLLIDLDLERGAISKVFDVDNEDHSSDEVKTKAITTEPPKSKKVRSGTPTCINNLWVWQESICHKDDEDSDVMNLEDLTAEMEKRYDRLIIYAPDIKLLTGWKEASKCIQVAMLFGDHGHGHNTERSCISDFHNLLISRRCNVLKPMEIFAEAV